MNAMRPIYRNEDTAVFRNERGRLFGLREIGDRKSWYRWQTPDGKRHRFAKDACAYLDGQQLKRDVALHLAAKALRERREREEVQRREQKWAGSFRRLATAWSTRKIDVRPERLACA